ncbi:hypothetical protein PENSPDRAFT_659713 [Peniophora sp. CONT]|nr:hypothetical protein PENSPDRAFT_659713 [Peniophora sp. CONT]
MVDQHPDPSKTAVALDAYTDESSVSSFPALPPSIFSLPPELLALLVKQVAEMETPRSPTSDVERANIHWGEYTRAIWDPIRQGGTLGWIRLTHVCRAWRSYICEGMPLLWAQHIGCFRLHGALEEMLRQAGGSAPLSVQSSSSGYAAGVACQPWSTVQTPIRSLSEAECSAFRSRIQSLRVVDTRNTPEGASEYDCLPFIMDDFSRLEDLEVHCLALDTLTLHGEKAPGPGNCVISATTLRSVRFTDYFIPWKACEITRLSLAFDAVGLRNEILHDVLTSVASTVEELELDFCVPSDFIVSAQDHNTYSFQKLRYLYLRDVDSYALNALRKCRFPVAAKLNLLLLPTAEWDDWVETSMKDVLVRLGDSSCQSMTVTATFREDPDEQDGSTFCDFAQLRFYQTAAALQAEGTADPPDFTITIQDMPDSNENCWTRLAIVRNIVGRNSPTIWNHIASLDFNVPLWRYRDEIGQMLVRLTHLRQLRLVDPFEELDNEIGSPGSMIFPTHLFNPSSRFDLLWIVQNADWQPDQDNLYCAALAASWDGATSFTNDEDSERVSREQPPIVHIRLDLVQRLDTPVQRSEREDLIAMFGRIAEEVELRFL